MREQVDAARPYCSKIYATQINEDECGPNGFTQTLRVKFSDNTENPLEAMKMLGFKPGNLTSNLKFLIIDINVRRDNDQTHSPVAS